MKHNKNFQMILISIFVYIILLLVFFNFIACTNYQELEDPGGLRAKINKLDGVTAIELVPYYGYDREFFLEIKQLVDHRDSSAGTFYQWAYLLHNDVDGPMVLVTNGYSAYADDLHEMTVALGANQISLSHRFFSGTSANTENYPYLTMEQTAGDVHHVVELFKEIYPESWLSSGFGKGGLTALVHRRYYPDDVNGTVCYSAPFLSGVNDSQPIEYLKTLAADSVYDKIKIFQQGVLKKRSEIIPYITSYMNYLSYYYYYTWSKSEDLVLELSVMDYPFEYWSNYNEGYNDIPDSSESALDLFNHLFSVVRMAYFSEDYIEYLKPAVYQSMTELGAVAYETEHLADLLEVVDLENSVNFNYEVLAPEDVEMVYNDEAMNDLMSWMISDAQNLVFLYGLLDPILTTTRKITNPRDNIIKLILEDGDHYVSITDFSEADQVYNAVSNWMGFEVQPLAKRTEPEYDRLEKFRLAK